MILLFKDSKHAVVNRITIYVCTMRAGKQFTLYKV